MNKRLLKKSLIHESNNQSPDNQVPNINEEPLNSILNQSLENEPTTIDK